MKNFLCLCSDRPVLPGLVAALVLLTAGSQSGLASTITLTSSSGGVYDYGLTLDPGEIVTFSPNQTISFDGLPGVTAISVSDDLAATFVASSLTSTSVLFAVSSSAISYSFHNLNVIPGTFGTLEVVFSALTTRTVDFSIESSSGTVTGTRARPSGRSGVHPGARLAGAAGSRVTGPCGNVRIQEAPRGIVAGSRGITFSAMACCNRVQACRKALQTLKVTTEPLRAKFLHKIALQHIAKWTPTFERFCKV